MLYCVFFSILCISSSVLCIFIPWYVLNLVRIKFCGSLTHKLIKKFPTGWVRVTPRPSSFIQKSGLVGATVSASSESFASVQACRPKKSCFWPAFFARKTTPWSRKSGHGLLLGCRSGIGNLLKYLFWRCSKKKLAKTREFFTVCSDSLSQSIGRGWISRKGALDVRESRERRDKSSC